MAADAIMYSNSVCYGMHPKQQVLMKFINATTKERRANNQMDAKTYRVVGISTSPQGETKIRFAQDLVSRIKTLVMRKHTNIVLRETPAPMSKESCIQWMITQADFNKPEVKLLADGFVRRNCQSAPKAEVTPSVTA